MRPRAARALTSEPMPDHVPAPLRVKFNSLYQDVEIRTAINDCNLLKVVEPPPHLISVHPSPIEVLISEDNRTLREIWIYRALLLGICCLTALDNSDVIDAGIGSQIVHFT